MRQRQIEPEKYTETMRKALDVILDDCDPAKSSSKKAAKHLYKELRKQMPMAGAGAVLAEAIWTGRNAYPSDDQRTRELRDHLIRSAVRLPMAADRRKG
ncbi:hypothetical protein SAMN04488049_13512 [Tritonibacter multivorans]|nr:hypothetical protein SAMN04488049_13512 [Tritonibacter multivorans]